MYRLRWLAPIRLRPLEAMGGLVAVFRGSWGVMWPTDAFDPEVTEYLLHFHLLGIRGLSLLVLFGGFLQFGMAYVKRPAHWPRVFPIWIQMLTIGLILTGYFKYDLHSITTAFYCATWLAQVWIWGDLKYALREEQELKRLKAKVAADA